MKTIAASEFKSKCLSILDEVSRSHDSVVVTKRGIPMARLIPFSTNKNTIKPLKGAATFIGDIISPIDEKWEADS